MHIAVILARIKQQRIWNQKRLLIVPLALQEFDNERNVNSVLGSRQATIYVRYQRVIFNIS